MNSFDISDSNITQESKSFNTLILVTDQREISPIRSLNSQILDYLKPQVLFKPKEKNELLKYTPPLKQTQLTSIENLPRRALLQQMLAKQEIYESFEVGSSSPCCLKSQIKQQDSILLDPSECDASIADSLFGSAITKHLNIERSNKLPVELSVSRHVVVDENGQEQQTKVCLNRFLCHFKQLQTNISKLQDVIDRINVNKDQNNAKITKLADLNPMICQSIEKSRQSPLRAVEMTSIKSKGLSIEAKSTRSESIHNTPFKEQPFVSQFNVFEMNKMDLDRMSPISSSKKKEKSFNVEQSSSSLLMKRKFSRKAET